ncbi:hypothetical protein [Francisella frigiditurris]|uniref:Putative membrane protein n=1 Tax=Francisella frigiditurris TaxID=1542390 RepID=A0A1J0KUE0_9GAMM|nr:hypothetical protein [Francisella frigiditurris]APC97389.1 putative membrane protein [Francisella frigiditurris]
MNTSTNKDLLICFIIYSISNIFLLTNFSGIYWDDLTLYSHSFVTINSQFSQSMGLMGYFVSLVHWVLGYIGNGIYIYRLLTFILIYISGLCLYKILETVPLIARTERFLLTLVFLACPLYIDRIPLIDFLYTFCTSLFYIAFYLVTKDWHRIPLKRLVVFVLFFISFVQQSLVPFYLMVLAYVFIREYDYKKKFKENSYLYFKSNIILIIIIVFFAICKFTFFEPSGLYAGYNKIHIEIFSLLKLILHTFSSSLIAPIAVSLKLLIQHKLLLLGLMTIIFILLFLEIKKKNNCYTTQYTKGLFYRYLLLLFVGGGIFILGALPYVLVGKVPVYNAAYSSRFQVLLPLGFAFIIVYLIKALGIVVFRQKVLKYLYISLVFMFVVFNIVQQYKYEKSNIYRQSIIVNLRSTDIIRDNDSFIYNIKGNWYYHTISFYEMNGLSVRAFGNSSKNYILSTQALESGYCAYKQYNCYNWKRSSNYIKIQIDYIRDISFIEFLKMKYYSLSNVGQYDKMIRGFVKIQEQK